jgi:spore germination protein YaaH
LGIPFYFWEWRVNPYKKVAIGTYKKLLTIRASYRHSFGFDQQLGVAWVDYYYKNKEYRIWFENEESLRLKLDIVKNKNLRGFSAWALGFEDPAIWKTFGN